MSHEVSETVSLFGGPEAINVSGHTGAPLPISWPFESPTYPTLGIADAAAEARSNLFGQLVQAMQAQSPQAARLGLPVPFVLPITPYDANAARHEMEPHASRR